MIVIADTTLLMKIDQLKLLNGLFRTVYIPKAVLQELTGNSLFENEA